MKITLAHSPDADDAFMFYAIAKNKIDLRAYEFEHVMADIGALSKQAIEQQTQDVTAISYHAYAFMHENYELLDCGSSLGNNYGPILITTEDAEQGILEKVRSGDITVAVPNGITSSELCLRLWSDKVSTAPVNFQAIPDAIKQGKYQAGLIIHELQVTYAEKGFRKLLDLGEWWFEESGGLVLPLGVNVIRRSLPKEVKTDVSEILRQSVQYALDHPEEATPYAAEYARGLGSTEKIKQFIDMYVNNRTLSMKAQDIKAVELFLKKAHQKQLIPAVPSIQFI